MRGLDFQGKVALVVGAGSGIGSATARILAEAGAELALADLTAIEPSFEVSDSTSVHTVDISSVDACQALVEAVVKQHGRIDCLINTAGVIFTNSFLDMTPDEWDRTVDVNARGAVFLTQAVARHMVHAGIAGSIVLVASIVASHPVRLNNSAYSASKAALIQASRCIALELAPLGIRVNLVSPGSTATQMLLEKQLAGDPAAVDLAVAGDLSTWRLGVPMGRLAEPEDQGAAIAFLASDLARHITGAELVVDGGQQIV